MTAEDYAPAFQVLLYGFGLALSVWFFALGVAAVYRFVRLMIG